MLRVEFGKIWVWGCGGRIGDSENEFRQCLQYGGFCCMDTAGTKRYTRSPYAEYQLLLRISIHFFSNKPAACCVR